MGISYIYCTTLLIVLVVRASALQGTTSISGDRVIGSNISILCSWTTVVNEVLLELTISSPGYATGSQKDFIYKFYPSVNSQAYPGDQKNNRTSLDAINLTNQSIAIRISDLQCSDEQDFVFTFLSGVLPSQSYVNYSTKVIVKAPPKSPNITITPASITSDVMEQTNISVTCYANLGRPGLGSIRWKIYRNTVPEIIPAGDSRIVETKNVSLLPGDHSCTQRQEQTFRMQVSRTDQNLSIACFVQNSDFQAQVPDMCQNPTTDLCRQIGPFRIVYAVVSVAVDQEPPGAIYQGMPVTLTCQANGVPSPSYTWVKVGEENTTLSGEMVDGVNRLALSDRVSLGHEGEYNCTASNVVLGQTYSATSGLSVVVMPSTTTTTTTTTTTPRTTTTPTTSPNNSVSPGGINGAQEKDDDDKTKIIIIVVVVVGGCIIIAIVIGIVCWRKRRAKKEIEEPSEKPYNNRTNLAFQNPQPDLVADKKFQNPTLDYANKTSFTGSGSIPSINEKYEDGLMYADLTYDNKPRSRKPMAINDSSSEYSDIQMPQV